MAKKSGADPHSNEYTWRKTIHPATNFVLFRLLISACSTTTTTTTIVDCKLFLVTFFHWSGKFYPVQKL